MDECQRWNIVSVPVENAAPDDTREESYKIAGSKRDWETLHTKIEQVDELSKPEQIDLVDSLAGDCPAKLDEQHKSLGIAKPETIHDFYIEPRDDPTYQVTIDGTRQVGKKQFPYQLYIEYECEVCHNKTSHRQHCIEWGVYNYFAKNEDPEGVIDALGLNDEQREHYFFVGNLNHQRSAYIIISDLRFKHEDLREVGIRSDSQAALGDF